MYDAMLGTSSPRRFLSHIETTSQKMNLHQQHPLPPVLSSYIRQSINHAPPPPTSPQEQPARQKHPTAYVHRSSTNSLDCFIVIQLHNWTPVFHYSTIHGVFSQTEDTGLTYLVYYIAAVTITTCPTTGKQLQCSSL